MAQPCHQGPPGDDGRKWIRQLTETIAGWGEGDFERSLPAPDVRLPSELIELRTGLELTRRALRAERAEQESRWTLSDGLTGLPNREHFTGIVRRMVARLSRHGGTATLLLLDLDNFRNINNQLGHEAGDLLLVAVGQRLIENVRAEDAVARLGGDEFAVLLEGTGTGGAEHLAQRLLSGFTVPFSVLGRWIVLDGNSRVLLSERGR